VLIQRISFLDADLGRLHAHSSISSIDPSLYTVTIAVFSTSSHQHCTSKFSRFTAFQRKPRRDTLVLSKRGCYRFALQEPNSQTASTISTNCSRTCPNPSDHTLKVVAKGTFEFLAIICSIRGTALLPPRAWTSIHDLLHLTNHITSFMRRLSVIV
jgi:hypothetical protein